ncbi:death domain-containing protein 1 isoform X1 [Channa argus]|uniref:death domain-containing protein 1 isoform X1 n=1 Tax=Channa argus TaxID=215402 RepID=UPI0029471FE9|nr:hypothetical protein Q8A73_012966 [Channa argus]
MNANVQMNKEMLGALCGARSEDSLLNMLTEAIQRLEAVKRHRTPHNGAVGSRRCTGEGPNGEKEIKRSEDGMLRPAAEEKEEEDGGRGRSADEEQMEKKCKQNALGVLREVFGFHADRVTAWRRALRECVCMLDKSPPEGSDLHHLSTAKPGSNVVPCSDSFSNTMKSVGDVLEIIMDNLSTIILKLDTEILQSCGEETSLADATHQETRDPETSDQSTDGKNYQNAHDHFDSEVEDRRETRPTLDAEQTPDVILSDSDCNGVEETCKELEVKCHVNESKDWVPLESQTNLLERTEEDTDTIDEIKSGEDQCGDKEETKSKWITIGLTVEESQSLVPDTCFIRASPDVAEVLRCEVADAFSCIMVTGSEELVSRVIRVKVQDGANLHFPVTLAVPFCTSYRSNYRDVVVKIVGGDTNASYVTPITTDANYEGQRGSFAEVRVYSLGLFAVVSCLKRENYTVPRRGLSLKLPMDSRVSLNYLPGSFTAPVMAQAVVQPVDAIILAAVKSRGDAYLSVVSTSPMLYLTHPTSQPLRRPLSVTLPCPVNPEKRRATRGNREDKEHNSYWSVDASPTASHRVRSLKSSKEMSNELLIVLGSRDKQWTVLEKVSVRNQQKGLVSFELTEIFDRLLVVRLLSPLQPCDFTSLAEELEQSVCSHMVTISLQRRQSEPHAILVAALPSRDLSWELNKLRAQGYSGLPETSSEISMCEGDQLLLRFTGNITSTGTRNSKEVEHITFHTQRRNQLLVHLTEVDPFGNYSSPYYKGTALFYKLTRGQATWRNDKPVPVDTALLGEPICKLFLTLPKKVRNIKRPITARVKSCEETDSLSDSLLLWLSGELSQEDIALLAISLRLRRSAAQLVKLRGGDSLSSQAFHVLIMWRRGQPAAPHQPKASQLAQCLAKSGRPDLARELLLRQAAAIRQGSLK